MNRLQLAIQILERLLFKPYLWAGDDPNAGFDCSGLIIEVFKSIGLLPRDGDWSAQGLFDKFKNRMTTTLQPGCLVFYGKDSSSIYHVEFVAYKDEHGSFYTIAASGGGSSTLTLADAIKQDAYIKIRPVMTNYIVAVNPF